MDRLLRLRLEFNRGERLIAQFTQNVAGAPAELAGDRAAGSVVVDPACDLEVTVVWSGELRRADWWAASNSAQRNSSGPSFERSPAACLLSDGEW